MMYLVLDVLSTKHADESCKLHAWVNSRTQGDAMEILSEELAQQGWSMTNLVESTSTTEDDYFPPCTSLDAFNEAKKGLLALRFFDL